jgi:hypothetical protein
MNVFVKNHTYPPDAWQRLANEGNILISRTLLNVSLENMLPFSRIGSGVSRVTSPPTSFSAQLLSQDQEQPLPLRDITTEEQNKVNQADLTKKVKRTRLLLDARTELTDDELRVRFMSLIIVLLLCDGFFFFFFKVARAKYLESQNAIRQGILTKKLEKNSGRIIEELVWGVPKGSKFGLGTGLVLVP